jgi:hypothetical protein
MPLEQIEAFLRRVMTDRQYCARFLREPEVVLADTDLDSPERWAVREALQDDDDTGHEFLALLRTRLALVGVPIGHPPADLPHVFAVRRSELGGGDA